MATFDGIFKEQVGLELPTAPEQTSPSGAGVFEGIFTEIFELLPAPQLPFSVIIAFPLNSNTIRVVFSLEPRHQSPLSANDSLNRLNWEIQVQAGPDSVPVVTLLENAQPQPALFPSTFPEAWSVDLRTDRQLKFGTTYLTIVGSAIVSATGSALQPDPDDRDDHPGIV